MEIVDQRAPARIGAAHQTLGRAHDALQATGHLDGLHLMAHGTQRPDERFERHLAVGGRMFVVIGAAPVMTAFLIERIDDRQCRRTELFDTVLEPLRGADAPERFHF